MLRILMFLSFSAKNLSFDRKFIIPGVCYPAIIGGGNKPSQRIPRASGLLGIRPLSNKELAIFSGDEWDYDARAEIMRAGSLAHNKLLNTGRTGDRASHVIEHELSALFDIAHGAGLSIGLPVTFANAKLDPAKIPELAKRAVKLAAEDS
jgi:alcohol dehydrogenase class IV